MLKNSISQCKCILSTIAHYSTKKMLGPQNQRKTDMLEKKTGVLMFFFSFNQLHNGCKWEASLEERDVLKMAEGML